MAHIKANLIAKDRLQVMNAPTRFALAILDDVGHELEVLILRVCHSLNHTINHAAHAFVIFTLLIVPRRQQMALDIRCIINSVGKIKHAYLQHRRRHC